MGHGSCGYHLEFCESCGIDKKARKTVMFLFRTLSVPGSMAKKAPIPLVLFSLLAQSCTAISGLSQRNDQSLALPQGSNETASGVQKVSVEPDGTKTSRKRSAKHALNGTA